MKMREALLLSTFALPVVNSSSVRYLDIMESVGIFYARMIPLVLFVGRIKPPVDEPAMRSPDSKGHDAESLDLLGWR
jgi:hypothetical protein